MGKKVSNLEEAARSADSMEEFFRIVQKNNISLVPTDLQMGGKIIIFEPKSDYALVSVVSQDPRNARRNRVDNGVHPYGSQVLYKSSESYNSEPRPGRQD